MVKEFKVLILGQGSVGKTSISSRYTTGGYKENHLITVGANFMLKSLELEDGNVYKLNIWDTAGQERFKKVVETYYAGGNGAIICYDISQRESYDEAMYWKKSTQDRLPGIKFVLVGNKTDLEEQRVIAYEEGLERAKKWGVQFFETSAKNNTGINEVFLALAREMIESIK